MPSDPVVTPETAEPDTEPASEVNADLGPEMDVEVEGTASSGERTDGDATGGEPSDTGAEERTQLDRARAALESPRERFHSTLVVTADQVRSYLTAHRSTDPDSGVDRVAGELGPFASGRIDPQRFAELVSEAERSDLVSLEPMERALDALIGLIERGDELHFVRVDAGGDLTEAVGRALAEAGRAFGAARVFEAARRGAYDPQTHDAWLASFSFRHWSRAERGLAPPLVIEVDGGDLRAAGLAEFLDGGQKLVLLVEGESPPAPLVRLVSPGVLVLQTDDPAELKRLAAVEGPAVGAIVPEGAGLFAHEPGAEGARGRLEVAYLPDEEPRRRLGSLSAFQQAEELRQLAEMAAGAVGAAGTVGATSESGSGAAPAVTGEEAVTAAASPGDDRVDRLAAWLLTQADLSDL
jgi:hypothetical protein